MRTKVDWAHEDAIEDAELFRRDGRRPGADVETLTLAVATSKARRGHHEAAGVYLRAADSLARMRRIEDADLGRAAVALWDERRQAVAR